jgi:hypothetical protein
MRSFIIINLLFIFTISFAENNYKNAIGWDEGISYRRILNDKLCLGVSFNYYYNAHFYSPTDSTDYTTSSVFRPEMQLGVLYSIMKYDFFNLNILVSSKFIPYSGADYFNFENTTRIGLCPTFTIKNRFLFEIPFGIYTEYRYNKQDDGEKIHSFYSKIFHPFGVDLIKYSFHILF